MFPLIQSGIKSLQIKSTMPMINNQLNNKRCIFVWDREVLVYQVNIHVPEIRTHSQAHGHYKWTTLPSVWTKLNINIIPS